MASGAEGNSCSSVLMDIESDVLTALREVVVRRAMGKAGKCTR